MYMNDVSTSSYMKKTLAIIIDNTNMCTLTIITIVLLCILVFIGNFYPLHMHVQEGHCERAPLSFDIFFFL